MVYAGHRDRKEIEAELDSATKTLKYSGFQLVEKNEISLSGLDCSLQKLEKLKPLAKQRLLKAWATSVLHDRKISPVEVEFLRAILGVLDCLKPPIIRQPVSRKAQRGRAY